MVYGVRPDFLFIDRDSAITIRRRKMTQPPRRRSYLPRRRRRRWRRRRQRNSAAPRIFRRAFSSQLLRRSWPAALHVVTITYGARPLSQRLSQASDPMIWNRPPHHSLRYVTIASTVHGNQPLSLLCVQARLTRASTAKAPAAGRVKRVARHR